MLRHRSFATSLSRLCWRWDATLSYCATQSVRNARATASAPDSQLQNNKVIVLTMPMLSPSMTEGSLSAWAKHPGDMLEPYDLVYELETETLTEEAYRVGDFAGTATEQPITAYVGGTQQLEAAAVFMQGESLCRLKL